MQSGHLRNRVDLQSQSTAQDSFGAPVTTWSTAFSCWAKIVSLQGTQKFQAGQFTSTVTHKISIRFPGVNTHIAVSNRITYRGRTFIIVAIEDPDGTRTSLDLLCNDINAAV
jgi:SPP1 family predicted phage head-tail adaptor